jgi:hypothetical protein
VFLLAIQGAAWVESWGHPCTTNGSLQMATEQQGLDQGKLAWFPHDHLYPLKLQGTYHI